MEPTVDATPLPNHNVYTVPGWTQGTCWLCGAHGVVRAMTVFFAPRDARWIEGCEGCLAPLHWLPRSLAFGVPQPQIELVVDPDDITDEEWPMTEEQLQYWIEKEEANPGAFITSSRGGRPPKPCEHCEDSGVRRRHATDRDQTPYHPCYCAQGDRLVKWLSSSAKERIVKASTLQKAREIAAEDLARLPYQQAVMPPPDLRVMGPDDDRRIAVFVQHSFSHDTAARLTQYLIASRFSAALLVSPMTVAMYQPDPIKDQARVTVSVDTAVIFPMLQCNGADLKPSLVRAVDNWLLDLRDGRVRDRAETPFVEMMEIVLRDHLRDAEVRW